MTDKDTITLPREVVEKARKALTPMAYHTPPYERGEIAAALRTALAAEQPKPEPVASDDDEEFTREDVTTLLLEVMDWVYAKAHRNRPMTEAEQKVLNDIRTHLAAEPTKPSEDIEALRRDNERLRELLTEARGAKWLVVQDNLLDRIDAALRREETT